MNAIITTYKLKGRIGTITAKSASGKRAVISGYADYEYNHKIAALKLSRKLGWGDNVIGGEIKEGFAYIPIKTEIPIKLQLLRELIEKNPEMAYSIGNAIEQCSK